MDTLNYLWMTEWFSESTRLYIINAINIIAAGLVLVALVIGAFRLIRYAKKLIRISKY